MPMNRSTDDDRAGPAAGPSPAPDPIVAPLPQARRAALLEVLLAHIDQGLMLVDAEHTVELCNDRAIEMLGLPPALMTRRPHFLEVLEYQWSTDEFRHTSEEINRFVREGGNLDERQRYERTRPDGRVIEVRSVPLEDGGILRTYTDITERRRSEDRIRHRARHDGLTNLLNRDAFDELLASTIMKSTIDGSSFAVHYLDLDHFKPVNDSFGHLVGDQALTAVAQRIRHVARDEDGVARLGGDEFAVLQRSVDRADQAIGLASRIVDAMKTPIRLGDETVRIGISVGIALFPSHGATSDALLDHADRALYRVKARGGGGVEVYGGPDPR